MRCVPQIISSQTTVRFPYSDQEWRKAKNTTDIPARRHFGKEIISHLNTVLKRSEVGIEGPPLSSLHYIYV